VSGAFAASLTVALGLSILALLVTVLRNRALRRRPSNVAVRVRSPGGERWFPGHGVWVNDVFAFRRSPAGWREILIWVTNASARMATEEERARLHRIGDDPVVTTFVLASGGSMMFAARSEDRAKLLGPYA
jgi:hypothetical protein